MKMLLHVCCAPCAIYPVRELRAEGIDVTGFFYNHNIHPYQEYRKRLETVREYAAVVGLDVIYRNEYRLEDFLGAVADKPEERCLYCYVSRMEATAAEAVRLGYEAFSTTLLYSRYQKHDVIRDTGERLSDKYGISFHYADFRRGWQQGIDFSRELALYRQQYCGCIYSEKERFLPRNKGKEAKAP